jgi:hypothetical protein
LTCWPLFNFAHPDRVLNEAASHQGRISNLHRQAVADLVRLSRFSGTEIAITAVPDAPADVCS